MYGVNEGHLDVNTKFYLQEVEWNPRGKSQGKQNKEEGLVGVFQKVGKKFRAEATLSEDYRTQVNEPTYPVQGGMPISDTGDVAAKTITINAVVSNSNISLIEVLKNPARVFNSTVIGQQIDNGRTYVEMAFDQLTLWADNGTPLFLKTAFQKSGYRDHNGDIAPFKITSFSIRRDEKSGDSMGFTLSLTQVYIARITVSNLQDVTVVNIGDKNSSPLGGRNEELLPAGAENDGKTLSNLADDKSNIEDGSAREYVKKAANNPP